MISRVADYCFWFGRYVERAESTARLLQATRTLVFDADLPVTQCWQPLIIVSGEQHAFCERFGADATGDGERVQDYLTWHPNSGVSLLSSVRAARECARVIRDTLSLDTWEAINELYHFLGRDSTEQLYHENREEQSNAEPVDRLFQRRNLAAVLDAHGFGRNAGTDQRGIQLLRRFAEGDTVDVGGE